MDDGSSIEARHRKELKALDGEKRAAVKKAKGTKGKKAKELLEAIEQEYATKLTELQSKHHQELLITSVTDELESTTIGSNADNHDTNNNNNADNSAETTIQASNNDNLTTTTTTTITTTETWTEPVQLLSDKERKQRKARRKRDKQRHEQQAKEQQLEQDRQGPSARQMELDILSTILDPLGFRIQEVPSDGNCLYRAIAAQLDQPCATPNHNNNNNTVTRDYIQLRNLCANTLQEQEEDLAPFCEFTAEVTTFEQYVNRVRNSTDWGGHLELRALSLGLQRTIYVYSAQQQQPLILGEDYAVDNNGEPIIRLSYHLHYYSLGEHYNQVIPKATTS